MNAVRIFLLLTLFFSHQASSRVLGWKENDDCNLLIQAACGTSGFLDAQGIAARSELFKRAMNEYAGFTKVTLANVKHPVENYRCDTINQNTPFGVIMYVTSHEKKTCIGIFTKNSKTKILEPIPLASVINQAAEFNYGFTMQGQYLCSPLTGDGILSALKGEIGNPLYRCAVNDKMPEEKKARQAVGATSGTAPTTQAPPIAAPLSKNSAFETAKLKCKQLGNKEGSNKFNKCVMTLME